MFVGGNITQGKAQKGINGLRLKIPSFTETLRSECHHIFMFGYEIKLLEIMLSLIGNLSFF
jgi:hypothetical protein